MRPAPARRIPRSIGLAALAAAAGLISLPLIPLQATEASFTDVDEAAVPVTAGSMGTFQSVTCQTAKNDKTLTLTWGYTPEALPVASFTLLVTRPGALPGDIPLEIPAGSGASVTLAGADNRFPVDGPYSIAVQADSTTLWTVTSLQKVSATNVGKKWTDCA